MYKVGNNEYVNWEHAVVFAKILVQQSPTGVVIPIWNDSNVVVGVATDDANGPYVHDLRKTHITPSLGKLQGMHNLDIDSLHEACMG